VRKSQPFLSYVSRHTSYADGSQLTLAERIARRVTWVRAPLTGSPYASTGEYIVFVGTAHKGRPFPGLEFLLKICLWQILPFSV
jgi:hypothetical protein